MDQKLNQVYIFTDGKSIEKKIFLFKIVLMAVNNQRERTV